VPARSGPEPVLESLPPRVKWRAILLATLAFVPAYWGVLTGFVAGGADAADAPDAGPAFAFGLAVIPFVFIVLAFSSQHPNAPRAVLRAMGLSLLVGIPASALAGDVVTGLVAGMGAGGIAALRKDRLDSPRYRALAVAVVAAYSFMLVRVASEVVLLAGPAFPFTALGIADHLGERRRGRERAPG
jgi:hypothetical protein